MRRRGISLRTSNQTTIFCCHRDLPIYKVSWIPSTPENIETHKRMRSRDGESDHDEEICTRTTSSCVVVVRVGIDAVAAVELGADLVRDGVATAVGDGAATAATAVDFALVAPDAVAWAARRARARLIAATVLPDCPARMDAFRIARPACRRMSSTVSRGTRSSSSPSLSETSGCFATADAGADADAAVDEDAEMSPARVRVP